MDHFLYREGRLHAEDVPVETIVDAVGTPVYVYARATLERHFRVFADALSVLDPPPMICYAVKANGNIAVIATLARLGAGADVVSGGELRAALRAGVPAERIVFSGVGKTADDLRLALDAGVLRINVESEPELGLLHRIALDLGVRAPAALRINPDVDAHTHDKISTGRRENKFGIEWTAAHRIFAQAASLQGLDLSGIAVHIGSQLTDVEPFYDAFIRVRDLVVMLRADGIGIDTLDLGGGLGVPYGNEHGAVPSPAEYASVVARAVGELGCRLIVEPGRLIVGNAGILVTRVLRIKEGPTRTFVIVDAGMNDLLRPALYDAWHDIVPICAPAIGTERLTVDVVGPICETSDQFASGRAMPPLSEGDLLAIRTTGAYGRAMASAYNARPIPAEVMVSGDRFAVVQDEITVDDLLSRQHMPNWLTEVDAGGIGPASGRAVR